MIFPNRGVLSDSTFTAKQDIYTGKQDGAKAKRDGIPLRPASPRLSPPPRPRRTGQRLEKFPGIGRGGGVIDRPALRKAGSKIAPPGAESAPGGIYA